MKPYCVIAAHRGTSLVSRIIALFRPNYSHCELWFYGREFHGDVRGERIDVDARTSVIGLGKGGSLFLDGVVITAGAKGVVPHAIPRLYHSGRGTVVDLFSYKDRLTPTEENALWKIALSHVGKEYDYHELLFGFTMKGVAPKSSRFNKLICSGLVLLCSEELESVMKGTEHDGKSRAILRRVREDRIAPRDLTRSPILRWDRSGVIA